MSNKIQNEIRTGLATARGLAAGPVFIYRGDGEVPIPAYVIEEGKTEDELQRLKLALNETRRDLEGLIAVVRERTESDDVKIFECHLMLVEDPLFIEEIEKRIREERVNAEDAVHRAVNGARAIFARMNDPYFRERVRDLDDVERRILGKLTGKGPDVPLELKAPSIVIADDLTPSETMRLPREYVLGFATNGGSTTSHVALLARAMGIPAITGLVDITSKVKAGETVLLNGTEGTITLKPDEKTQKEFSERVEREKKIYRQAVAAAPAGTLKDGGEIVLYANLHPGVPFDGIREQGARGIGLYRSEYLWLNREGEPSEEEQFEAYREAAEFTRSLGEAATLTIRVLDIGGDKLVRGLSETEDNPFLGNRSIRYLLSHREVFRTQLRAILRASVYGKIGILYPMISGTEELAECAKELAAVKAALDNEGIAYDHDIKVGAMIEVPSAAINARSIAKFVDFLSIGTNDLIQYTMAADRGNEKVAHLYQPTNPAVIELMRWAIDAGRKAGIPVGVCGESASDPVVGVLWAAMGVDILSMSATYIPVMSHLLSQLSRADLDEYLHMMEALPDESTGAEVFAACEAFLKTKVKWKD